jgi:hypothetical protein
VSFHAAKNTEFTLRGPQFFITEGEIFPPSLPDDNAAAF